MEVRGLLSGADTAETCDLLEGSWHLLVRSIMRNHAVSGKSTFTLRSHLQAIETVEIRLQSMNLRPPSRLKPRLLS